jgi:mRNA interferase MazF
MSPRSRHRQLLPAAATGFDRDSEAQAEQIRSVAIDRVVEPIGRLPDELMQRLEEAMLLHLGI